VLVIRVTFADGATEDREDASPAFSNGAWILPDPATCAIVSVAGKMVGFSTPDGGETVSFGLEHTGRSFESCRVWRITSAPNEPLAGEWAECHVETCEEQIARLTTERDGAAARANHLEVQKTVYVRKVAELRGLLADEGKRANAEKARADRLARHARALGQVARITLKGHGYYGFRTARYGEADALRARARRHGEKDGESK
jgi:hypothetical protein